MTTATRSATTNNIAAALRSRGVSRYTAMVAAEYLDDQFYLPSQVRTTLRVRGLSAPYIAEAIEAAELHIKQCGVE